MTAWEEVIGASTFAFVEALERRGFRADARNLTGRVGVGAGAVQVEIDLPHGFPFEPPIVSPPAGFPRSWHRERNGAMCLYPAEGRDNLPWLDVGEFVALVERWLAESGQGWASDFPDLDLERYFEQAVEPLVVYGDLDMLTNKFVQLRCDVYVTRLEGPGSIPRKKRARNNRAFGYVTDIGEPAFPPSNWDELKALIAADSARVIESAVMQGRLRYLFVRYSRSGTGAVVVLSVSKRASGAIELASVRSASQAPATLALRAGASAASLAGTRVAVVGVGAIGSFVCDLLARAGVGTITAYDPDILRPGNLIRHAAAPGYVGLGKPAAVKHLIESRPYNVTAVTVGEGTVAPLEVMKLFASHDLIIDASAAGGVTHLLAEAAIVGGRHVLSVCVQADGDVVRVDVVPPLNGVPIPATVLGPAPVREDLHFEAGCGDPVSQTPAFAVVEAASLAARHAIGLLTGSPVSDAGAVYDFR